MTAKYETANGVVTERVPVELARDEAAEFAAAWEHIREAVDVDSHPIFRGLRRIHAANAIENPANRKEAKCQP